MTYESEEYFDKIRDIVSLGTTVEIIQAVQKMNYLIQCKLEVYQEKIDRLYKDRKSIRNALDPHNKPK